MGTALSRRLRRIGASLVCGVTIVGVVGSCASTDKKAGPTAYCALMPDSVGLYVGNPITHMGYPIGTVTAITPSATSVRVDFTVAGEHRPPTDVRAVTRSSSILTDRELELVGDFGSGAALPAGGCIPLERSSTPKSLSEVIGSATTFLNAVTPENSDNITGVVSGLDQAMHGTGAGINRLLTTSSSVLDSPDQAIGDIGTIVTNLAELTTTLRDIRDPLKQVLLDAEQTTPDIAKAVAGGNHLSFATTPLIGMVSDLEANLGDETQQTLDALEVAIRKASAHSTFLANFLKPGPVIINWLMNHANNKALFTIRWRPPLYRIPTPIDGLLVCGAMNASMPGSCADVNGTPYAVDVALLQYVLNKAANP